MSKAISFIALSAAVLVACSDAETENAAPTTTPAAESCEGAAESSASTDKDSAAPSKAPSDPPAPIGPKVTPSPVEVCEGAYECPYVGRGLWLMFDGKECKFGSVHRGFRILYPDGRAKDGDKEGRWTGNAITFTLDFGENTVDPSSGTYTPNRYTCTRMVEFDGLED